MTRATSKFPHITVWANGRDTQSRHPQSTSTALIQASSLDGTNARPALDGEDGKNVELELIPNGGNGFSARGTIGNKPSVTHVQPGYDLLVSARGSHGEDGGKGGNGKQGERGCHGNNATRDTDATPGGEGGQGGDGGIGSSGGNGGNGGKVRILTTEENMHLLLAVDWDVRRGKGGKAGEHGVPGRGGKGGRGGAKFKWQEPNGYKWNCVDHTSTALSTSNQAAMSRLRSGRDLAFSFPAGTISDGTNVAQVGKIQGVIPASIAPQFQRALMGSGSGSQSSTALALRNQLADASGHEPGCRQIPLYTTHRKPGAADGKPGPLGSSPTLALVHGRDGINGTGEIHIRNGSGAVTSYDSAFEFQLLGFEVADENDDGIFEPGECVIIKNITIKNSGEMPTPKKTPIPLRMQPNSLLKPVHGKDVVYLPFDIPPGGTRKIRQTIWAEIMLPSGQPNSTAFKADTTIKLMSVVPDLDRKLPHFDSKQDIIIQYPIKLLTDEIKWLDTIPQGSSTSFQWGVMNISSKELGSKTQSQRRVFTKISCSPTSPAILGDTKISRTDSKCTCREHEIETLQRDMGSLVSEKLSFPKGAPEYSTTEFLIELILTPASATKSRRSAKPVTLQTCKLSVQVSKTYMFNADSDYLLLTSKSTTKETVHSWVGFIKKELHMSADEWNVSLYGGLETEATRKGILDRYLNKTILALDDDLFHYFDQGQRSILDFIDPHEGSTLSRNGTRIVSVQCKAESRHKREGKNLEHVAQAAALKSSHLTGDQLHHFTNVDHLVAHLHQLRQNQTPSVSKEQYFIPCTGRNGNKVAKKLNKEFPLDNFLVTDSADGQGVKVVHCGAHGQGYSTAQVAQTSNGVSRNEEFCGLNGGEAYTCVAALPLKARLDILLASDQYSQFVQDAALSSVKVELHNQIQAMAKHSRWRDGLFGTSEKVSTKSLFDSANDSITAVLEHEMMRDAGGFADDQTSLAGQILRSIIQSARCQTNGQLWVKWIIPVRRTRSHVRRSLMKNVENVITSSAQSSDQDPKTPEKKIKAFRRSVSQRVIRKNYQADINSSVSNITHDAIRDVKQSMTSIEEVMPKSVYQSAGELSTNRKIFEKAEMQRRQDKRQHREWKAELGMNMMESAPVELGCVADNDAESTINSSKRTSIPASETSKIRTLQEMEDTPSRPERKIYPSRLDPQSTFSTTNLLKANEAISPTATPQFQAPQKPTLRQVGFHFRTQSSRNIPQYNDAGSSSPETPPSLMNSPGLSSPSEVDSPLTPQSTVEVSPFPELVHGKIDGDSSFNFHEKAPGTPTPIWPKDTEDEMYDDAGWLDEEDLSFV